MSAGQLPSFLLIGTNKSGTSTLYHVLKTHPQLFLPDKKELHFFSGAADAAASGDITPNYLDFGEKVIPRIAAWRPRQSA